MILQVVLPLSNILYRKNIPTVIQSLGSTGDLPLFYSLIAHSITRPSVLFRATLRT